MRPIIFASIAVSAALASAPQAHGQQPGPAGGSPAAVYINGSLFTPNDIHALQAQLGIPQGAPVPPGRYWYDNLSGLWGPEGGPAYGQILPGLELGGPLRRDASGGSAPVFINGRALHPLEIQYLQQLFGYVIPGRYWLDWQGNLGAEGGPPLVNLIAVAQAAGGGPGVGYGGYTRRTPFGGLGGDGNCSYYLHPDGPSVMNC